MYNYEICLYTFRFVHFFVKNICWLLFSIKIIIIMRRHKKIIEKMTFILFLLKFLLYILKIKF